MHLFECLIMHYLLSKPLTTYYPRQIKFVRNANCTNNVPAALTASAASTALTASEASTASTASAGQRSHIGTMELAENCTYSRVLNDQAEAVDDATAGMIIVILLFVLPSSLSFWPFVERTKLFTINI